MLPSQFNSINYLPRFNMFSNLNTDNFTLKNIVVGVISVCVLYKGYKMFFNSNQTINQKNTIKLNKSGFADNLHQVILDNLKAQKQKIKTSTTLTTQLTPNTIQMKEIVV